MTRKSKAVVFDTNPGRNAQTYGIARELGTDMDLIHEPSVGVIGTKGDSQCYLGVQRKVEAIHEALRARLGRGEGQLPLRLVQPEYTVATSDGMRNGTREMRYSLIGRWQTPRDIVGRDSIRNAVIVAMAIGGSTNVMLHAPEIARAAGFGDFARDIMSPQEFNHLSEHVVPVLTDARPYGRYSMVDIADKGGVQVIVKALLDAGLLNGDVPTCTGETLAGQLERLGAGEPDGTVVHPVGQPFKETGGLRVLGGNLCPDHGAVLKLAGVEGGLEGNRFVGRARPTAGSPSGSAGPTAPAAPTRSRSRSHRRRTRRPWRRARSACRWCPARPPARPAPRPARAGRSHRDRFFQQGLLQAQAGWQVCRDGIRTADGRRERDRCLPLDA